MVRQRGELLRMNCANARSKRRMTNTSSLQHCSVHFRNADGCLMHLDNHVDPASPSALVAQWHTSSANCVSVSQALRTSRANLISMLFVVCSFKSQVNNFQTRSTEVMMPPPAHKLTHTCCRLLCCYDHRYGIVTHMAPDKPICIAEMSTTSWCGGKVRVFAAALFDRHKH